MSLLDDLLLQISKSDFDEQVKKISDQIMAEESPNFFHPELLPKGNNIFLSIEFTNKHGIGINFLCLERELKEKYIVSLWSKSNLNSDSLKRKKVWEIQETKVEKIFKFYAEKLKFLKGE